MPNSAGLPTLTAALREGVSAGLIRRYIRGAIVEDVVKRLYDIGMGEQTFEVPTMMGNVVTVPASAKVQTEALKALLTAGVPSQIGLSDESGEELSGVLVMGPLGLDEARRAAQGERYAKLPSAEPDLSGQVPLDLDGVVTPGLRADIEIIEIEEGEAVVQTTEDAPPPPVDVQPKTLEQLILARRRARRNGNGNGKTNGTNGSNGS